MRLLRCLGSARPTARISALSGEPPRMPATRTRVTAAVDVRGCTNERRPNGKCDCCSRALFRAILMRRTVVVICRDWRGVRERKGGRDGAKGRPESDCARARARGRERGRENSILQSHGIISNYCRSVGIVRGAPPERKLHLRGGSRLNTRYIPLTLSTQ